MSADARDAGRRRSDSRPDAASGHERSDAMRALHVFRGDASGGREVEYQVPVEPGMVVLDAIHWIQAPSRARPRGALELQGRQVRLVQRRGERQAGAHVQVADGPLPRGQADHACGR